MTRTNPETPPTMPDDTANFIPRRRSLLAGGAGLLGGLLSRPAAAQTIPAWTHEQGSPITSPPYGAPSPFEARVIRRPRASTPFPTAASSNAPLQDLHGIITPAGLHYERHHAGVPQIDPDQHKLLIHGLVDRPLVLTLNDLLRFPSVSRVHFLECSGNTGLWSGGKPEWTAQDTHGLLSCSEWTGVALSTVLAEVGLQPEAKWILAEGADGAAMTRSIPVEKALDDAILAYAQNGERLRPEQGYPLRLFLPGFEGNTSVKWLRRLKVGDQPFDTREETSKYTDLLPDGRANRFNFVMEVKSVVTSPSGGQTLTDKGFREITGLAWSGHGKIRRVEVSVDSGATWREARLQEPVLSKALTRFRLPWNWQGEPALLASRATDEYGNVQPTHQALLAARGANYGYHYNAIHAWRLSADGRLTNAI